jgi:hypothetical protein
MALARRTIEMSMRLRDTRSFMRAPILLIPPGIPYVGMYEKA